MQIFNSKEIPYIWFSGKVIKNVEFLFNSKIMEIKLKDRYFQRLKKNWIDNYGKNKSR
jgi:hypothetical protein